MSTEPRYPYVHIDLAAAESDDAGVTLFDLGAQGVEERDASTLVKGTPGKVTLVASFASHGEARAAVRALPKSWKPRVEEVVGDAWRDEWKKHFHPFEVCRGVVIRPPWQEYVRKNKREIVLELEPGRAFGTGLHETTSLVADAIRAHAKELAGEEVLDVGCGSGILSLVALALGAAKARAVDIDPDAAAVTQENAARNALAARVVADTKDVAKLRGAFRGVFANIEARVLIPMARALIARTEPGGLLVLSGILAPHVAGHEAQVAEVKAAYASMKLEDEVRNGEWVALVYRGGALRRTKPAKRPAQRPPKRPPKRAAKR